MNPHETPWYCRTCKRALNRFESGDGRVSYLHISLLPAEPHTIDPAPAHEVDGVVMVCDFCSTAEPAYVYTTTDVHRAEHVAAYQSVDVATLRDKGWAAPRTNVGRSGEYTQSMGERWTACAVCADLIDSRDLMGLVWRATESLPSRYRTPKRLPEVRANIHAAHAAVLAGLLPGRGVITPEHPLGDDYRGTR
jgi:hypothetical protein